MRKISFVLLTLLLCVCVNADAAVRTQQTQSRQNDNVVQSQRQSSNVKQRTETTSSRVSTNRSAKKVSNNSRAASTKKTVVSRSATNNRKISTARITTNLNNQKISRAASTTKTVAFSEKYVSCRDAYFSCMDQFCAMQNETYRRCVCSSKLKNIQTKEQKISQTSDSLKDFQDINIDAISKTSAEVHAMGSASSGEQAIKKDKSNSASTLNNISSVLSNTKQKSQPAPTNTNNIWGTTDLIGGADIANLTGEALYNSVHSQCAEIVQENCSATDLEMVASAYGVYIENDCATLENSLNKKTTEANAAIRNTRQQMHDARLENYNAHNSLSLNDCIAKVRENLTENTACGQNYIHCLDVTGKYLNSTTGEPIYSAEFYQIENQISLSGDVLKNNKNSLVITVLNEKRPYAQKSLDLCRDDADKVWDEFLRQAIVEIYQGQQQRVHDVKSACLKVVNDCYLKQTEQLKTFSDNSADISLGQTLELSEEMCKEKLTTCSNLYGGGSEGLKILVNTMSGITDETIAQTCPDLLEKFITKTCAVSANDSVHSFPYGCRAYAPGDGRYARTAMCNLTTVNPFDRSYILLTQITDDNTDLYKCKGNTRRYKSCNFNYYLYDETINGYSATNATECRICPQGQICAGGTSEPTDSADSKLYNSCGEYYVGSLYHQLVRYALQNCTRPSNNSGILAESLLGDVDKAMKKVQTQLVSALSTECENQNGTWVEIPWQDADLDGRHDYNGNLLLESFYSSTGTNKLWGYCRPAN